MIGLSYHLLHLGSLFLRMPFGLNKKLNVNQTIDQPVTSLPECLVQR